jgi:hypothetical protein
MLPRLARQADARRRRTIVLRGGRRHWRRHHIKANLPPAGQLDIDLRKQRGIKQSPVTDTMAAIHAIARAQRVQAVFRTGMPRL